MARKPVSSSRTANSGKTPRGGRPPKTLCACLGERFRGAFPYWWGKPTTPLNPREINKDLGVCALCREWERTDRTPSLDSGPRDEPHGPHLAGMGVEECLAHHEGFALALALSRILPGWVTWGPPWFSAMFIMREVLEGEWILQHGGDVDLFFASLWPRRGRPLKEIRLRPDEKREYAPVDFGGLLFLHDKLLGLLYPERKAYWNLEIEEVSIEDVIKGWEEKFGWEKKGGVPPVSLGYIQPFALVREWMVEHRGKLGGLLAALYGARHGETRSRGRLDREFVIVVLKSAFKLKPGFVQSRLEDERKCLRDDRRFETCLDAVHELITKGRVRPFCTSPRPGYIVSLDLISKEAQALYQRRRKTFADSPYGGAGRKAAADWETELCSSKWWTLKGLRYILAPFTGQVRCLKGCDPKQSAFFSEAVLQRRNKLMGPGTAAFFKEGWPPKRYR